MSFDNLFEWLEKHHPEAAALYEVYEREQTELHDAIWEKHLETYGREDVCPKCGYSRFWVEPMDPPDNLLIACNGCDNGLFITYEDGTVTKIWVSELIVGGKQ